MTSPTLRPGATPAIAGGRDATAPVARRAEATSVGNPRAPRSLGFAVEGKGDMAPLFAAGESELAILSPLSIIPA